MLGAKKTPDSGAKGGSFKVLGGRPADVNNTSSNQEQNDQDSDSDSPVAGIPVLTKYEFADVPIPSDFLSTPLPPDATPVTIRQIDWSKTPLPQNKGAYAVVLDNVLSPSECETLLDMVEQSVPADRRGKGGSRFWRPALVNVGNGFEVLHPEYRNSDRIIWDQQEVVDRLWRRCLLAPGLEEKLRVVENDVDILGAPRPGREMKQRWEYRRVNKRMRFLKYGPGQFFSGRSSFSSPLMLCLWLTFPLVAHCDGPYREDDNIKTIFTVHLYLNDSKAEAGEEAELVGGATSFLSRDEQRKVDVDPKAGRVLIFQHRGLYHEGAEVFQGIKYTMRTDIMYELVHIE